MRNASVNVGPDANNLNLAQFEDQARMGQSDANNQLVIANTLTNVNGPCINNGVLDPILVGFLGQRGIEVNVFQNGDNCATLPLNPAKETEKEAVHFSNTLVGASHVGSRELGQSRNAQSQTGSACGSFDEAATTKTPHSRRGKSRAIGHRVRVKSATRRGRPRNHDDSSLSVAVPSDSDIIRCNDVFWKTYDFEQTKKEGLVAKKVAKMSMEVGVTGFGDEGVLVKAIQNLEDRDNLAKAGKRVQNKSQ